MASHQKNDKTMMDSLESSPRKDFARAELGDSRRVERLLMITGALMDAPEKSFPEVVDGHAAKLEATYRFFGNDNIAPEAIIKPHIESTCQRAEAVGRVYVVQDTTDLTFECRNGDFHRQGLGSNSKYTQSLHVHCALAVSADGTAIPLGLLDFMTWTKTEEDKAARAADWIKSKRWYEQLERCKQKLTEEVEVINLWDREGDSYENLAQLSDDKQRYIIRGSYDNRPLLDENGHATGDDIRLALASQKVVGERTINVGARRENGRSPSSMKKNPPRKKREAVVGVRAARLRIKRPCNRSRDRQPFLDINIVEVVELTPPDKAEPVRWLLLTSEPIDTQEQMWEVVDGYRTRWVIEEFFKCLKTGCSVEKRQLKSRESLERMLAVMMPLAWRLLLMRDLSRSSLAEQPATLLFSDTELDVLAENVPHRPMDTNPTLGQATLAMAALGGHLKQSGPPGWLTLWRGFRRLQELHTGYLLGLRRCVER